MTTPTQSDIEAGKIEAQIAPMVHEGRDDKVRWLFNRKLNTLTDLVRFVILQLVVVFRREGDILEEVKKGRDLGPITEQLDRIEAKIEPAKCPPTGGIVVRGPVSDR